MPNRIKSASQRLRQMTAGNGKLDYLNYNDGGHIMDLNDLNDLDDRTFPKPKQAKPRRVVSRKNMGFISNLNADRKEREARQKRVNYRSKPTKKFFKRGKPIAARVLEIGKETYLHPDTKTMTSLWACKSVPEVMQLAISWDKSYLAKCLAALKKRKLPDEMRVTIEALLTGNATSSPNMLNPNVLALAREHCHRQLVAKTKDDPDIEFALVTFIPGDGATSAHAPFIDLGSGRSKVLRAIRAMARNSIGVTEIAMFKSHRHRDGGRHIQRHEHFLIYGKGVIKAAQMVAQRRMDDFDPNLTEAPQIDVRRVAADEVNLARMCAYLFKPPHKTMNWVPAREGKVGFMNQTEKGDRMINYLRMAQIRSMLTIDDILLAGGECKAIKSDLIKLLRETCRSDVPVQTRRLHPDAVASFWSEVNKALNRLDYQVPVIGRSE